jgi:hypothetical protein
MLFRTVTKLFVGALTILFLSAIVAGQEGKEFEPGSDETLEWAKNYEDAVNTAKTKYMPILLYFYGREGTDLCKLAETEVFKKSSVKSQAKKFVCVKIEGTGKEGEELCKKYEITPGSFAIVLLDYQLTESAKIKEEKDLNRLADIMKKTAQENKKTTEILRKIEKAFNQAMECKRKGDMKDCVALLEEIASYKGKSDSKFIDEAQKILAELEREGAQILSEAEREIQEAEKSLLLSSQYFRLDLVNSAQQKLARVARDYPVSSLKGRLNSAQTRIASLTAEYQRRLQPQQGQGQGQGQGGK